ncbi:MAG: hypothetical protein GTO18_14565 [Anaerolineales bacterium]|nr:hypothetical protein [Anaerolineales bacterium]
MTEEPGPEVTREPESLRYRGEKDEKGDEKQREKSWEEKWVRDPINAFTWALILIWAGVALLLDNLDIFDDIQVLQDMEVWSIIFTGAGIIVLISGLVRALIPEYRRNVTGTFVFGAILLGVGLGELIGWEIIGAFIVLAIGVGLLLTGIFRRR